MHMCVWCVVGGGEGEGGLCLCVRSIVDCFLSSMRSVQKVSDLNFSRLNKSSTESVHLCRCGGDIYAHA